MMHVQHLNAAEVTKYKPALVELTNAALSTGIANLERTIGLSALVITGESQVVTVDDFENHHDERYHFVGMIDGVIMAYCCWHPKSSYRVKVARIRMYAISEDYRGQGYGTLFMKEIKSMLKKKGYIGCDLNVCTDNPAAINTYLSTGFTTTDQEMYCKL